MSPTTSPTSLRLGAGLAATLLAVATATAAAAPASAATTYIVGSEQEYRDAIADINADCGSGDHTISFEASVELSDPNDDGPIEYTCTDTLTLRGDTSANPIGDGHIVVSRDSAADPMRLLNASSVTTHVVVDSLTVRDFHFGQGGGALRVSGDITVVDSIIEDNSAEGSGGAMWATYSASTVTIERSIVRNNAVTSLFTSGGAISAVGDFVMIDSLAHGNSSTNAGGVLDASGDVTVESSSFVDNFALNTGGAIYTDGTSASISNSTLVENETNNEGTSISLWSNDDSLSLDISHSIIVGSASSSASMFRLSGTQSHSLNVFGSAIDTVGAPLCFYGEPPASETAAHSWFNTDDCITTGDGVVVDDGASLDYYESNVLGLPPVVAMPVADSDLIDAIPAAECTESTDARGVTRPVGDSCDIGPGERVGFTDVASDHPFANSIEWLAAAEVSTGYDDDTFRPSDGVSRMAMAAFLQRFAEPDFAGGLDNDFTDVGDSHAFASEISWLADGGISTGYDDGTFRPSEPVTRQAMAAFLYRVAGEPAFTAPATASFTDVPTSHPFFAEIEWMADNEISTGYDDDTYRGTSVVSRMAMAAFLERLDDHLRP